MYFVNIALRHKFQLSVVLSLFIAIDSYLVR